MKLRVPVQLALVLTPPLLIIIHLIYLGFATGRVFTDYLNAAEILQSNGGVQSYLLYRNATYLFYLLLLPIFFIITLSDKKASKNKKNYVLKFLGFLFLGVVLTTFAFFLAAITLDILSIPSRVAS